MPVLFASVLLLVNVVFLLRSPSNDLLPLSKHVQVELREYRNVRKHYSDKHVVEVKRKIETVWERDGVRMMFGNVGQTVEAAEEFSGHSQRVQPDKKGVPKPSNDRRIAFDEVECVVSVSNDFCDGPCGEQHRQTLGHLRVLKRVDNRPGHEDAREDLEASEDRVRPDEPDAGVENLQDRRRLEELQREFDRLVEVSVEVGDQKEREVRPADGLDRVVKDHIRLAQSHDDISNLKEEVRKCK